MKTLYELLDVLPTATRAEIAQGYRNSLDAYLARQGVQPGEDELIHMQAIREAYLVLSSVSRRQAYDERLSAGHADFYESTLENEIPWIKLLLVAAFVVLGASQYYKIQRDQSAGKLGAIQTEAKVFATNTTSARGDAATHFDRAQPQHGATTQTIQSRPAVAHVN